MEPGTEIERAVAEVVGEPLIEVVYWRHFVVYLSDPFDSIEEALRFIESGEDHGSMSAVGVYVGGDPAICSGYVDKHPPTPEEALVMREDYREAAART